MISALPGTVPFINSKRVVALATTGKKRSAFLPDLPTLAESGVPGYEFTAWFLLLAPAKTPADIIAKVNAEIGKAGASADYKEKLTNLGAEVAPAQSPATSALRITPDLADPYLYFNRDLSWLEFNQRVLDQALDDFHPLLERVNFLAISGSNLDEFFMVRVATHLKKLRSGHDALSPDGRTVTQQLADIRARAATMFRDQAMCWEERLRPSLAEQGIRFLVPGDYTAAMKRHLTNYFRSDVFPLLTPLAFDPGHPFPLISNRSKNLAVVVRHQRRTKFARVKIPPALPRFIPVPDPSNPGGHTFAFLEDVIRQNLPALFSGIDVVGASLFRVLRDVDMELPDDGSDDLLESVNRTLKQLRHGSPVLLQVEAAMTRRVLNILAENFEIDDSLIMRTATRLDFADWMSLTRLPIPALKDPPFTPRLIWGTPSHEAGIFDDIREQDRLLHHPFDSFTAVEAFVGQAASDPHVVGIKMTLYRIGANSPLIDTLIAAADAGKQVAVLVELKARFDEKNNIQWAERLEEAGVHVVYGLENLKTHCKLCLIVRKEPDGVRRYVHISTGNYNAATSQVYTDFGLFTTDARIVEDVSEVFNYLTGYSNQKEYRSLIVAPAQLRTRMEALIAREADHARAGRPAQMIIKINALTDDEHPCQALADMQTLIERWGSVAGRRIAFVGDGNNVCTSVVHAAMMLGVHMHVATPKGFELPDEVVDQAAEVSQKGAGLTEFLAGRFAWLRLKRIELAERARFQQGLHHIVSLFPVACHSCNICDVERLRTDPQPPRLLHSVPMTEPCRIHNAQTEQF